MNGYVDKLYDINSIEIPAEMLETHVDEARVEAELQALGLRYAVESEADIAAEGDTIYAKADMKSYPDGRTILVYTGTTLPGAEDVAKAVISKRVGDVIETTLADKKVTLTIAKILRRTPVAVDDALIAKIGVDGVSTVGAYRNYIRAKLQEDQNMEQSKMLVKYIMDEMIAKTTYAYDEAEMESYVEEQMKLYANDMEEDDMDYDVSEADMREGIREQTKQEWMVEAFAKSQGVEVDRSAAEEQADQMIEMMQLMGEEVPARDEMIRMAIQDEYMNTFFDYAGKIIEEKTGGNNNGNN